MGKIKKSDVIDSSVKTEFEALGKSVKSLIADLKTLIITTSKSREVLKSEKTTLVSLNVAKNNLNNTVKQTEKVKQKEQSITERTIKTQKAYFQSLQALNKQKQRSTKLTKAQQIANESANGSYNHINAILKKNIAAYNKLSEAQRNNKKVGGALLSNIKKQDSALKKMDATMGKSQRQVGAYGRAFSGLKGLMGAAGIVGGISMFIGVLKSSIKVVNDYSKANSNLAAVLGTTKDETTALMDESKRLGAATRYTATEITNLQAELAKKGYGQEQIIATTAAILNLATASDTDLANAAEIVSGNLNAMGQGADQATRYTDVMAKSFSSTALDIEKFKTAMGPLAPVLKTANESFESGTAKLGVLADANIDASTSGTGLRNIYLDLAKRGLSYDDAMTKINTSTNKSKTAMDLFGKRGATVALVLADNVEKTNLLTESLLNSEGAAFSMAQVMEDNMQGDIAKLSSAWDGLILSFEDGDGMFSDLSRHAVQGLTAILAWVQNLGKTFTTWFDKMMSSSGAFRAGIQIVSSGFKLAFAGMKLTLTHFWNTIKMVGANIGSVLSGDFSELKKNMADYYDNTKAAAVEYANTVLEEGKKIKRAYSEQGAEDYKQSEKKKKIVADIQKQNEEMEAAEKERQKQNAESEKKSENQKRDNATAERERAKAKRDQEKEDAKKKRAEEDKQKAFIEDKISGTQKEMKAVKVMFANNEITAEQYSDRMIELSDNELDRQIKALESLLEFEELTDDQRMELAIKLSDAKIALEEKEREEIEKTAEQRKESALKALDQTQEMIGQTFDLFKGYNDAKLQSIENSQQAELLAAGDNELAKQKINEKYDKERAKIQTRQAKADKAKALFDIGIAMAVGLVEAFPNPYLMGLIGTLGIANLAIVAAKPIPKFAKGVKGFSGGVAELGEEDSELVRTKDGMFLADHGFYNLPKGTDVFTASETKSILSNNTILSDKKISNNKNEQEILLKALISEVRNKEDVKINVDRQGLSVLRGVNNRYEIRREELIS